MNSLLAASLLLIVMGLFFFRSGKRKSQLIFRPAWEGEGVDTERSEVLSKYLNEKDAWRKLLNQSKVFFCDDYRSRIATVFFNDDFDPLENNNKRSFMTGLHFTGNPSPEIFLACMHKCVEHSAYNNCDSLVIPVTMIEEPFHPLLRSEGYRNVELQFPAATVACFEKAL